MALIPLTLFAVGLLIALNGASYDEVRSALANPFVGLMLMAMIGGSLYHMWLGMQDIILDYVHGDFGKYSLLILNTVFSIAVGAACAFSPSSATALSRPISTSVPPLAQAMRLPWRRGM